MRNKYLFILVLIVSACSFLPAVAEEKVLDIKEVTSKSGAFKAWFVEDHTAPVIAVDFTFRPDRMLYTDKTQGGIVRLTLSMLDEGAGQYDSQSFQKMLEDFSINLGFSSGRDSLGGSLYMLSKYKNEGVEALKLAMTQPRFDQEPLERIRRSIISSMKRSLGKPERMQQRLFNHYAYPDHYYRLNKRGTLSQMQAYEANDLRDFLRDFFVQDTIEIAVAGDITEEELAIMLDEMFGDLPLKSVTKGQNIEQSFFPDDAQIIHLEKKLPQTFMEIIWPGFDPHHKDFAAFSVMNYIFGRGGFSSRLMHEIREKRGLTYGVYSYHTRNKKSQRYSVSTSTKNANVDEMRRLILQEAAKMAQEPVSAQELKEAKQYLTGSMVMAFTSTSAIAGGAAALLYNDRPIDYYDGYKDRINAVTAEDIQRVAKMIFEGTDKTLELYVGQRPSDDALGERAADIVEQTYIPGTDEDPAFAESKK